MEQSEGNNPKFFSNSFLEKILRDAENDDSITVTETSAKDAAEKGDHYGSSMYRLSLKIKRKNEDESKSLIVKVQPKNELFGSMMSDSTAFPREIKMFTDVLPAMDALLENAAPGWFRPFGARSYYSEDKPPYLLILEDLAVIGCKLADKSKGVDLDHSLLVMENIGRFHAAGYVLYSENPDRFKMFSKSLIAESEKVRSFMLTFIKTHVSGVANAVEKWGSDWVQIARKLKSKIEAIVKNFETYFGYDPDNFNVLIHGDFWVNNMMFRYAEDGKVKDVTFVDFQLSCILSFAIDLQEFISTSVSDDVRENHLEQLLKAYYSELSKTLAMLGYSHKVPSYEKIAEEYERKSYIGFVWSLCALPIMFTPRGTEHEFEAIINEKETSKNSLQLSEECVKVFKRLLPVFQEKGYF